MSQPSLNDYPGYFPATKPPFWNRTKAAGVAAVGGLFLGLVIGVSGAESEPTPPAVAPVVDSEDKADVVSEADVGSAVAEAVGAVRESMTAKLEQQRATAAARLERVKTKAVASKTKAVERAIARTRTEEQRKAARAVANALAGVDPEPPPPPPAGETDPRFDYCYNATDAGYGPYYQGETEYDWYDDADNDGVVCE